MASDLSLDLLGLRLTKSTADATHGFAFNVIAEGATFGVAQSAQEIVTSLLADGDLVRITRFGNREVSFPVEVAGPTLGSLAHGEAALRAVIGRSGDLVWQPPDALAVPTAFDVITSSMEFRFDDLSELRKRRVFMVTLTCLPFGRSVAAVTVPALSVGGTPTTVVVDTCDATTGWTGSTSPATTGTLSASSGAVRYATAMIPNGHSVILTRSGSVALSSTRYLAVEWQFLTSTGGSAMDAGGPLTANGLSPISTVQLDGNWRLSTFQMPAATVTSLAFAKTAGSGGSFTLDYQFAIREVRRSNQPPGSSPRQVTRTISVGGTERTPASIHVQTQSGSGALGQVIVHTCPEDGSGYSPPLRRWRVSGNGTPTSAADAMSGAYEPIHPSVFRSEVPNAALPAGGYIVAARMATDTPGIHRIAWSTSTIAPLGEMNLVGGIEDIQFFNANQWVIVPLAAVTLPTTASTGANVKTRVDIQRYSGSALINVDEAWLFREDEDCGLTVVGTSLSQLWLDSPSATSPVPKVWVGDGSATRVHPSSGLAAMGTHVLSPEGTAVFTAAVSDNPATDGTFYRRWHTNAAS